MNEERALGQFRTITRTAEREVCFERPVWSRWLRAGGGDQRAAIRNPHPSRRLVSHESVVEERSDDTTGWWSAREAHLGRKPAGHVDVLGRPPPMAWRAASGTSLAATPSGVGDVQPGEPGVALVPRTTPGSWLASLRDDPVPYFGPHPSRRLVSHESVVEERSDDTTGW